MNTFGPNGFGTNHSPRRGLWFLRIVPLVSLGCLTLAIFLYKSGNAHNFLIGLTAGLLFCLTIQAFATRSIELNEPPQPSDVNDFRLTR